MMFPTLISVSVAPGSYFFCAWAAVANASPTTPASATDLACLNRRCIIVLPDVLADGSGSLCTGSLMSLGSNAGSVCTIGMALPAGLSISQGGKPARSCLSPCEQGRSNEGLEGGA